MVAPPALVSKFTQSSPSHRSNNYSQVSPESLQNRLSTLLFVSLLCWPESADRENAPRNGPESSSVQRTSSSIRIRDFRIIDQTISIVLSGLFPDADLLSIRLLNLVHKLLVRTDGHCLDRIQLDRKNSTIPSCLSQNFRRWCNIDRNFQQTQHLAGSRHHLGDVCRKLFCLRPALVLQIFYSTFQASSCVNSPL